MPLRFGVRSRRAVDFTVTESVTVCGGSPGRLVDWAENVTFRVAALAPAGAQTRASRCFSGSTGYGLTTPVLVSGVSSLLSRAPSLSASTYSATVHRPCSSAGKPAMAYVRTWVSLCPPVFTRSRGKTTHSPGLTALLTSTGLTVPLSAAPLLFWFPKTKLTLVTPMMRSVVVSALLGSRQAKEACWRSSLAGVGGQPMMDGPRADPACPRAVARLLSACCVHTELARHCPPVPPFPRADRGRLCASPTLMSDCPVLLQRHRANLLAPAGLRLTRAPLRSLSPRRTPRLGSREDPHKKAPRTRSW